jgi:hypothetical protein
VKSFTRLDGQGVACVAQGAPCLSGLQWPVTPVLTPENDRSHHRAADPDRPLTTNKRLPNDGVTAPRRNAVWDPGAAPVGARDAGERDIG